MNELRADGLTGLEGVKRTSNAWIIVNLEHLGYGTVQLKLPHP